MDDAKCDAFMEFMWLFNTKSAILCAESTAKALQTLSGSPRPWIELSFGVHARLDDNKKVVQILEIIRPSYLDRAPYRNHPAKHGMGDVIVQHPVDDFCGALKRVLPDPMADPPEKRNVVEEVIKRCPHGQTFQKLGVDRKITHDEYLDF